MQDLDILWSLVIGQLPLSAPFVLGMWFATWRSGLAIAITATVLLIFVPIHPFAFGVTLAALTVMGVLWRRADLRKWTYLPAAAVVSILPYAVIAAPYARRYHEMEAIRDLYPPMSIADRLAYELRPRRQSTAETEDESHATAMSAELARFDERLQQTGWEQGADSRSRALWGLDSLHEQLVHEFTEAEGFGAERAVWPDIQLRTIDLPEPLPLPVSPGTPSAAGEQTAANDEIARGAPEASPAPQTLREMHESGVIDFVNPRGFGAVVSRERVRGFQSHGFRSPPAIPTDGEHASRWRVARLELVSLLKHETPVAYVSENLPRMQELAEAPTRVLDPFEMTALDQLRSGEGLAVEREADELRMLGSLRAGAQCVKCHTVKRGDLLGAFTYRLRRENLRERRENVTRPTL